MDKARWRAEAKRLRAGLDVRSADHCRAIAAFLAEGPAGRVVVYDAMPSEVDLAPLIAATERPEDRYAVTRTPDEGYVLTVHPWGGPMEDHPYGYRQPTVDAPVVPDADIAVVLVPALAFDRAGTRLGRGKGYYDRFLGRLPAGVAFVGVTGGSIVDGELPSEPFDVAMTHLATGDGVFPVPIGPGEG